jgi:hypothetical protein
MILADTWLKIWERPFNERPQVFIDLIFKEILP